MILIIVFSTLLLLAYLIMVAWMYPVIKQSELPEESSLSVSVVIPFRNEQENLPRLLNSLVDQNYKNQWEVLLVNDHSDDDSVGIVEQFISENKLSNFVLIHSPEGKQGKKSAIALGAAKARGEVLVQTDADCTMAPSWLKFLIGSFNNRIKLTIAPVAMVPQHGFWSRFAALEFLSLQATGAAYALRGKPIMGSAANMVYLKSLPNSLKMGGSGLSSGDDVFMIQALAMTEPDKVKYILHEAVQTYTPAPANFSEFIAQRARWGSKTTAYTSPLAIITALLVGGISVLAVLFFVLSFFNLSYGAFFLLLMLAKGVADYLFLKKYAEVTSQQNLLSGFFIAVAIYPFYILITGIAMFFSVTWKGRIIQK